MKYAFGNIITVHTPLSREVFWHKYAKIPRHTSKNAVTEGDFNYIFARNCEGTEQLPCHTLTVYHDFPKKKSENVTKPL